MTFLNSYKHERTNVSINESMYGLLYIDCLKFIIISVYEWFALYEVWNVLTQNLYFKLMSQ